MQYRRQRAVTVLALVAAFVASALVYPDLPERMATHWNASGTVDDTMAKPLGAFAVPLVGVFAIAVMYVAPRIDPRKQHYEAFRGVYEWFIAATAGFLSYVHLLVLAWNLGHDVPIGVAVVPAFAVLFYGVGMLLDRAESNWFVGIRTPWTLADEDVWAETHDRGARAFKLAAVLSLGGLLVPRYAVVFALAPLLLAAAYAVGYSYLAYRRKHEA